MAPPNLNEMHHRNKEGTAIKLHHLALFGPYMAFGLCALPTIFFLPSLPLPNKLKRTPVLDIPAFYVNLALTVGFTLMTTYALFFLYRDFCKLIGMQEK